MGIWRGTKLAFAGVVGAVLAWTFRLGATLEQYEIVRAILDLSLVSWIVTEYPAALDWSVGVLVGIVVADLVGYARARNTERNVRPSSTLGIGKGTVAVAIGVFALVNNETLFAEFARQVPELAEFVETYLGRGAFCFAVGIWLGAIVGETARL